MIYAYSDGGCKGNPGPGGWGAVIKLTEFKIVELKGFDKFTTNNKMELTATIQAIKSTPIGSEVTLTTDSKYVIDGITKWIYGWKKKGWTAAGGGAVKNIELWKELDIEVTKRKLKFEWVRGHTGHPENERCDELANEAIASGLADTAKIPGSTEMIFEL